MKVTTRGTLSTETESFLQMYTSLISVPVWSFETRITQTLMALHHCKIHFFLCEGARVGVGGDVWGILRSIPDAGGTSLNAAANITVC